MFLFDGIILYSHAGNVAIRRSTAGTDVISVVRPERIDVCFAILVINW